MQADRNSQGSSDSPYKTTAEDPLQSFSELAPVDERAQKAIKQAHDWKRHCPNIIIFGDMGAGKSSIVNMLDGDEKALVSDNAAAQTLESQRYARQIKGRNVSIFDTAGLNEKQDKLKPNTRAIINLYLLLRQLDDGVNLLVYVMKGSRIKQSDQNNYKLFFEAFCDKKVPIVLIITNMEGTAALSDQNQWWEKNKKTFAGANLSFKDCVCVTSTQGGFLEDVGRHAYQRQYDQSKSKIEDLIAKHIGHEPWKVPRMDWFSKILVRLNQWFGYRIFITSSMLYDALKQNVSQISDEEAKLESNKAQEVVYALEGYWDRFKSAVMMVIVKLSPQSPTTTPPPGIPTDISRGQT